MRTVVERVERCRTVDLAQDGVATTTPWLKALGASEIVDRNTLSEPGKPLGKERWAGAIDSVGSHTLANVVAGTQYLGAVAACGLAQGMDFPASVAPFILRGVQLIGVDSVHCPKPERLAAWDLLAKHLSIEALERIGARTIYRDVRLHRRGTRVGGGGVVDWRGGGSGLVAGVGHAELEALRAAQLESQLAQARLETLRAQLNPHFLFNALNLERTQDDAGRVDYELPNFNYATTDELSAGFLGFAADNYRTGTQSFVFNFVSPAIAGSVTCACT